MLYLLFAHFVYITVIVFWKHIERLRPSHPKVLACIFLNISIYCYNSFNNGRKINRKKITTLKSVRRQGVPHVARNGERLTQWAYVGTRNQRTFVLVISQSSQSFRMMIGMLLGDAGLRVDTVVGSRLSCFWYTATKCCPFWGDAWCNG